MTNDLTSIESAELSPFVRRPTGCGVEVATKLARVLIGSYPREPHEPEIYTRAIVSVLAEQPAELAREAVDRVTRASKYLPTRAEVCEALAAIVKERSDALKRREAAMRQRLRDEEWERGSRERAESWANLKAAMGDAWEPWNELPVIRRYSAKPEEFAAGWKLAADKDAFCASWGLRDLGAA